MKNIKIEFTNERIISASGLAVVGVILGKSDLNKISAEYRTESDLFIGLLHQISLHLPKLFGKKRAFITDEMNCQAGFLEFSIKCVLYSFQFIRRLSEALVNFKS